MHKIPCNLPDVIQSLELLQEAADALGMVQVPRQRIEEIQGGLGHTFKEDSLNYKMSRPLDMYMRKLAEEDCYQNTPDARGRREELARTWGADENLVLETDSDSDDGDSDMGDAESKADAELECHSGTTKRKLANGKEEKTPRKKLRILNEKQKDKARKARIKYVRKKLHRRAGQLGRMRAARQKLEECHVNFKENLKPRLVASLPPGEIWIEPERSSTDELAEINSYAFRSMTANSRAYAEPDKTAVSDVSSDCGSVVENPL